MAHDDGFHGGRVQVCGGQRRADGMGAEVDGGHGAQGAHQFADGRSGSGDYDGSGHGRDLLREWGRVGPGDERAGQTEGEGAGRAAGGGLG